MKRVLLPVLLFLLPLVALADNAAEKMSGPSAAPATDAKAKNLLKPTNDPESWTLELTEGGKGDMKADGDAIVFNVTDIDDTNWHVQSYQTGLDLKNGKEYVVKFKAKAPKATELLLVAGIHQEDWHEVGLHEELGASDDFKQYEFTFTANDTVPNNNRLGFVMGANKGPVSIKDLTLSEK
jgi:Carbohydrate binding domain